MRTFGVGRDSGPTSAYAARRAGDPSRTRLGAGTTHPSQVSPAPTPPAVPAEGFYRAHRGPPPPDRPPATRSTGSRHERRDAPARSTKETQDGPGPADGSGRQP